ncbi:hypothetical protein TNCT_691541 [Trichonephila clavata]|uniref:Uncharacterized protein n=1 Tax=Trichonephila clavata TaxID=2740835 RepID=A0A8X6KU70_TRICU|nr:hypothetical protein TNCT_691541 [Trichonephila clavata]
MFKRRTRECERKWNTVTSATTNSRSSFWLIIIILRDSKLSRSWPALEEFDLISISEIDFRALKEDPKNFRNQEKGNS